jgi:BON domain-containing protein
MMDIGVAADEAVVTLTGTVTSRAERLAAEEAAHRVAGVVEIANRIQVEAPRRRRHHERVADIVSSSSAPGRRRPD